MPIPAQVLNTIGNNTATGYIILRGMQLNDSDAAALAAVLRINDSLSNTGIIGLENNLIGIAGIQSLAAALLANPVLKSLWLGLNQNIFGDSGARIFASVINTTDALGSLNLFDDGVSAETAIMLAQAIAVRKTFQLLYLMSNPFGLSTNNTVGGDDVAKAFADTIRNNPTMIYLSLANCSITDVGANALLKTLEYNAANDNTVLRLLPIHYNPISQPTLTRINNILSYNYGCFTNSTTCPKFLRNSTALQISSYQPVPINANYVQVVDNTGNPLPNAIITPTIANGTGYFVDASGIQVMNFTQAEVNAGDQIFFVYTGNGVTSPNITFSANNAGSVTLNNRTLSVQLSASLPTVAPTASTTSGFPSSTSSVTITATQQNAAVTPTNATLAPTPTQQPPTATTSSAPLPVNISGINTTNTPAINLTNTSGAGTGNPIDSTNNPPEVAASSSSGFPTLGWAGVGGGSFLLLLLLGFLGKWWYGGSATKDSDDDLEEGDAMEESFTNPTFADTDTDDKSEALTGPTQSRRFFPKHIQHPIFLPPQKSMREREAGYLAWYAVMKDNPAYLSWSASIQDDLQYQALYQSMKDDPKYLAWYNMAQGDSNDQSLYDVLLAPDAQYEAYVRSLVAYHIYSEANFDPEYALPSSALDEPHYALGNSGDAGLYAQTQVGMATYALADPYANPLYGAHAAAAHLGDRSEAFDRQYATIDGMSVPLDLDKERPSMTLYDNQGVDAPPEPDDYGTAAAIHHYDRASSLAEHSFREPPSVHYDLGAAQAVVYDIARVAPGTDTDPVGPIYAQADANPVYADHVLNGGRLPKTAVSQFFAQQSHRRTGSSSDSAVHSDAYSSSSDDGKKTPSPNATTRSDRAAHQQGTDQNAMPSGYLWVAPS